MNHAASIAENMGAAGVIRCGGVSDWPRIFMPEMPAVYSALAIPIGFAREGNYASCRRHEIMRARQRDNMKARCDVGRSV
jgi:hypothetical protein